jgi:ABC-type multidrug transport system fused ATPase/permease subunit
VTFNYKGSTSEKPAIRNVTCTIKPGSLVVIVGANGSGKTSLVKLLTRLHEPTSGEILIDSTPIGDYRVRDLRNATAVLSQSHYLFPLSLGENIGVGSPDHCTNMHAIKEAARKGGALEVIKKRDQGLDTLLEPIYTKCYQNLQPHHALIKEVFDKWEKSEDISGGESQRIVA